MKFLFTSLFFGTMLIVWGLSVIIELIFGITLPIFRISVALLLIYAGVMLVRGLYPTQNQKNVFFASEQVKSSPTRAQKEYKIVFGQAVIDLSDFEPAGVGSSLDVYVLFGSATILLNPAIKTMVVANSILSHVQFPDKSSVSLGSYIYKTDVETENAQLIINATAVFSAIEIK